MDSSDHTSRVWGRLWFTGSMIEDLCCERIGCMVSTLLKQVLIHQSLLFTCRHFKGSAFSCVCYNRVKSNLFKYSF